MNNSMSTTWTEAYVPTSEVPFAQEEEEDAIVTLVVIVIGIIVAMVILFTMGVVIDCKHQKKDSVRKRKLRLKMPRVRRSRKDDERTLASDMCPNGTSDIGFKTTDEIV